MCVSAKAAPRRSREGSPLPAVRPFRGHLNVFHPAASSVSCPLQSMTEATHVIREIGAPGRIPAPGPAWPARPPPLWIPS